MVNRVVASARSELPTVAEVLLQTRDQEYRSDVLIPPNTGTTGDTPGQSNERSPAESRLGPIILILIGIALTALGVFLYVRHVRQAAAATSGEMLSRARGAAWRDPASVAPSAAPATSPSKRPSRRGSLSAAVHGRQLAHQAILANREPESPERGDGRLDRSSSADEGWPPPGSVEARLTALERTVEYLDHTLAARRAAAALRMAEQAASARPSDDLMRQPEADEARTSSPVHDHSASADSTNAEPQQVARRQRNESGNDAQAGNEDQRSTENRDRSTSGEDQIK